MQMGAGQVVYWWRYHRWYEFFRDCFRLVAGASAPDAVGAGGDGDALALPASREFAGQQGGQGDDGKGQGQKR